MEIVYKIEYKIACCMNKDGTVPKREYQITCRIHVDGYYTQEGVTKCTGVYNKVIPYAGWGIMMYQKYIGSELTDMLTGV